MVIFKDQNMYCNMNVVLCMQEVIPYSQRIRSFFERWPGCMAGALLTFLETIPSHAI